jgi:cytidine deaminase
MTKHTVETNDLIEKAFEVAKGAQDNSYSPYSHFAVGAAFKFKNDEDLYPGCNVENASYGATICAERSAILSKVSKKGQSPIEFVVVLAHTETPTLPCALCLQVMSEFCEKDFPIYLGNQKGLSKKINFRELLPHSFDTLEEGQKKKNS